MIGPTVTVVSMRTGIVLVTFTVIFTALMALAHRATRDVIAASAEAAKMKLVDEVLPRSAYDNALLSDYIELAPAAALGTKVPTRLFRARLAGKSAALVLEAVAPDGYGGNIRLLIALRHSGEVVGVRVTEHKETPGLGDYIDPRKDRNKARPWITQFNGTTYDAAVPAQWRVRKDGGRFDQVTGATVSARAVTNAVGRALAFAMDRRDKLFELTTGSTL
jgi:electron transport complex protein RnfG